MTSAQAVAGEVRAYLARKRISGRQAALKLGWTPPYLSRRLIGEIPFNVAELDALAGLLDVPVTAFFDSPLEEGVPSGRLVRKSAFPVPAILRAA